MTNYRLLLLLLLLCGWRPWVFARKKPIARSFKTSTTFQFTAPVYNLTIEENARGKDVYATSNMPIRIGVELPDVFNNVRFRIVEGEKMFKAELRIVDNFAFLRLRHRQDGVLNRELKDRYEFLIKATCKRKDVPNLETTATVNLVVTDRNDARPIFDKETYAVQVLENIKPLSNIIRVQASDADIDYNGQIYYSIIDGPPEFIVDPVTGWIRNLKPLLPKVYELNLLAEDRASRLYKNRANPDENESQFLISLNKAKAIVTVLKTEISLPKLTVEKRPVFASLYNTSQQIALIRAQTAEAEEVVLELLRNDYTPCFRLARNLETNSWLIETVPGHIPEPGWKALLILKVSGESSRNISTVIDVDIDETRSLRFPNSALRFSVNESSPLGFVIGRVQAAIKNGLKSDYRKLRYFFALENGTVPFQLNERSGYLQVSDWLDFESTSFYKFKVIAELKEYNASASVSVEVVVKDSNDHTPVFAAKWARGEPIAVDSTFPLNKTIVKVEALDSDSGDNGRVQYMLTGTHDNPFVIDLNTGEIKLWRQPSSNSSSWQIRVRAFDNGWPYQRSSEMTIIVYEDGMKPPSKSWPSITRDPLNHNEPVFSKPSEEILVEEDTEEGKIVAWLKATDKDEGYAGVVRFGCFDDYFAVHPFTGAVYVLRSLQDLFDYDSNNVTRKTIIYKLNVNAYDMGEPMRSSSDTVTLTIEDCNNHSPQFEKSFYQVRLREDRLVGTKIIAVKAVDRDFGENGRVGYRLTGDSNHVEIDSAKGVLRIREEFDREASPEHCFTVVAYDHGQPSKLGFANVTITLDDVNDNAPQCVHKLQKVQIPEDYPNGALVTCIAAVDPDSGENGRIAYAISATGEESSFDLPFRIQPDTGCIFISAKEPLDYEKRAHYNISIKVTDNGQPTLSSLCGLVVELIDVNENLYPPIFSDFVFDFSVDENMPVGTVVHTLQATDPDDETAVVKFLIVDGSGVGYFSVDSNGVLRTSAILDHEVENRYWLAIKAEDAATVPLSSIVHVLIRVVNKNDHAPLPQKPVYFVTVPENSPDTVVVKVEAEDKDDLSEPKNRLLRYSIVGGDPQSFFSIDPETGYMTTLGKRLLDREKQKEHEVIVEVCDRDPSPLCTTVPVVVTVGDRNDNPPVFKEQSYKFDVPAEATGILCRVFAIDLDEGENALLSYNISSDPRFSIDEDGHISTSEGLKPNDRIELTVQATEVAAPHNSASTRVTIIALGREKSGSNNGKPTLVNNAQWSLLSVSDTDNVEEVIGRIEADDSDQDKLWWSLVGGNVNNTFAIRNDTGVLVLAKPLEHLSPRIKNVHLKFSVSDGLETIFGEVNIEVARYISRRPQFSAMHYRTQIPEKTPVGSLIYKIRAKLEDSDLSTSNTGKPLTYSVKSVESIAAIGKIRIDPTSGNVFLTESLDRQVAREFSIIVSARNGHFSNFAMLTLSLTNEEDAAPKFLQNEYVVRMFARSAINSIVTTVRAYDLDFGKNGVVGYSIVAGNEGGYFGIDEVSGEIRVAKALPASEFVETVLDVRATDKSELRLSDTCSVRIQSLLDEEWLPIFQRATYNVSVRKNTPTGTLLTMVGVESAAVGVRYFLQEPCLYFEIHQVSGAVYLKREIKTDKDDDSLACTVIAKTAMGIEASAQFVTKIIDVNEYAPFFNQTVYAGFIEEGKAAGSVVVSEEGSPLMVQAYDRDAGLNGVVNYRIVSPLEPYFTVDFVSGVIRSKAELDFEKVKQWSFYVQANDMGSKALSSSVPALVTVTVKDVNDVAPKFERKEFVADLLLPTLQGVMITKLTAFDPDTVGTLRFFAKSTEMGHLFTVNNEDGVISVKANNSSLFKLQKYEVPVFVSDGIHSDSSVVIISVMDSSRNVDGLHFSQDEYQVSITENKTSDPQPLYIVRASGASPNAIVTYRIVNPHPEFVIGSASGEITWLGGPLDREVTPQIKLLIQAHAKSGKRETAQTVFVVTVEDVNDCDPYFVHLPYVTVVSKEAKSGFKALSVKAVDMDQGDNGAVRYTLKSNQHYFKVNKYDGKITVAESLANLSTDTLTFTVEASDQGFPSRSVLADVVVNVVDHETPIFTHYIYRTRVSEGSPIGTHVLAVKAVSNSEREIGYLIEDGDLSKQFYLDFNSGFLRVYRSLDRERISAYNLSITAIDLSKDNVYARSFVFIDVDDVNDNPPQFEKAVYRLRVSEATSVGSEILKVTAFDPDISSSSILYSISGEDSASFLVDATLGIIRLIRPLDYEKHKDYRFIVTASDSDGLSSSSAVLVLVADVNDNPPEFVVPSTVTVTEDAVKGQFLKQLEATDPDSVSDLLDGHRFRFSVIDGDETLLDLHKSTGVVKLARTLMAEDMEAGVKSFNLSVSDGVYTAYSELKVKFIASANRHPLPVFERLYYSTTVRENGRVGSLIATVAANGQFLPMKYSLVGDNIEQPWPINVDEKSGNITTRITLDYETQNSYRIPLLAIDDAGRRAFAFLVLRVINENDNAPQFVSSRYELDVPSDAHEGETLFMAYAVDKDIGDYVEYGLLQSDFSDHFKVHPEQGILSVQKSLLPLDRKVILHMRATDQGNPPYHSEAEVVLNLLPSNLSLPRFTSHQYVFNISEDAIIGAFVGQLEKHDQLDPPKAVFELADRLQDPEFPFSINKNTGKIIVTSALDRKKASVWRFTAKLTAGAPYVFGSLALVSVHVSNPSDGVPVFVNGLAGISVAEDALPGAPIGVSLASTANRISNSHITYSLEKDTSSRFFNIDSQNGLLSVAEPLDREVQEKHTVVVIASASEYEVSKQEVEITVTDVNDSPPVFDRAEYLFRMNLEDELRASFIGRLNVTDADLPKNNRMQFFITSGNDYQWFRVDKNGTLFVRQSAFPLRMGVHNLTVVAFDGRHYSAALAKVDLSTASSFDCSDENIHLNVAENSTVGAIILRGYEKAPADVHFDFMEGNIKNFKIMESGKIVLAEKLDRRSRDQHSFAVRTQHANAICVRKVAVTVEDSNDGPPIFDKLEYFVTVKENLAATENNRHFLTKLTVGERVDKAGGEVLYEFDPSISDSFRNIFHLDSKTGVLSLVRSLDREVRNRYLIPVKATDKNGRSSTATVDVEVADENDNEPQFENNVYKLELLESAVIGQEIGRVHAVDEDMNDRITYTIDNSGGAPNYFAIDEASGILKLVAPVDYEQIKQLSLTVTATDSGTPPLRSYCTVEVKVLDVNDNPPKFGQSSYRAVVRENAFLGTKVIKVVATDPDSDGFGHVKYRMSGAEGYFKITDDGWIIVSGELDREKKPAYRLRVTAFDGGSPPLTTSAEVIVDLEDVNDNPPTISPCNITAVVEESVEPGHMLAKVSVTDADIGPNAGPFRINIVGDGSQSFSFDSNFNLVTNTRLSFSRRRLYLLNVAVFDNGGLSSVCPLTVHVKEESRHPPEVSPLKVTVNMLMNEFLGGKIGVISAKDQDPSDMLFFAMDYNASTRFNVNSETGELSARPGLKVGDYNFIVNVTDGKYTVQAPVRVNVRSITQDDLDQSVSIRLHNVTAEKFLADYVPALANAFAHLGKFQVLSVKESNTRLSEEFPFSRQYRSQWRARRSRVRRTETFISRSTLDVLFVVLSATGFLRQERIQKVLNTMGDIAIEDDVTVTVILEACNQSSCVEGECIGRLYFDESDYPYFAFGNEAFSAPSHIKTFECICREGFGGDNCSIPVNECSKEPCKQKSGADMMMCVPTNTPPGYECVCPPGRTGDRCDRASCLKDPTECSKEAEISVNGKAFFQMLVTASLEETLRLSFDFRTISSDAYVMYGSGESDFHALEIQKGYLQYRWDCGAGVSVVNASAIPVSDGKNHSVEVYRKGHKVRLTVDHTVVEGSGLDGGEVVNLRHDATRLTFGARVDFPSLGQNVLSSTDYRPTLLRGMIGCFGRISIDNDDLPKTKQGLRLFNTGMSCSAFDENPCSSNPCKNGGFCEQQSGRAFRCMCSDQYTGQLCEHRLSRCIPNPCRNGGSCSSDYDRYYCSCPSGYTGRECESRDQRCFNYHCGPFGACTIGMDRLAHCNCSHGYKGKYCEEPPTTVFADILNVGWVNLVIAFGIVFVAFLLLCFLCIYIWRSCSRRNKRRQIKAEPTKDMEYESNNFNPRVSRTFDSNSNAPPLPPRSIRSFNTTQLSNFHPNLPTVQVRPFPANERFGSSSVGGSRSPSLAESVRCKSRRVSTPNSQKNLDFSRNCVSSADELEQSSHFALHRYGKRISEEESEELSSSSSQMRSGGSGRPRHRRSRIRRSNRGDHVASLLRNERIAEESVVNPKSWNGGSDRRVNDVYERVPGHPDGQGRLSNARFNNKCIRIGETVLAPEDDEYMTMHPINRRLPPTSTESQRRPLLETSDSEGTEETPYMYPDEISISQRRKPVPPAHGSRCKNLPPKDTSRVYDNPTGENPLVKFNAKVCSSGSLKRPLSSPNLSGDFGHIDSENDARADLMMKAK